MPPTPPNYKILARARMKRGLLPAAIAARERAQRAGRRLDSTLTGDTRLSTGATVPNDMVDRVRERFRQEGTLDEHAAAIRQRSISAAAQALAQLPRNPRVGTLTSPTDILKRRKNIRY
jgi:hypothetical protein